MPGIPWTAILTHGPAIVAGAKRLLETAGRSQEKNQSIEARLDKLEKESIEAARLLQELAQQAQALASAQAQTAQRVRTAVAVSIAALVVGVGASILALIW